DRFQLYAAVRELAREKRGDVPTHGAAAARHAAHFAARGAALLAMLEGPRHAEGAAGLARESPELRAAFEHAVVSRAPGAVTLARASAAALGHRGGDVETRPSLWRGAREATTAPADRAALLLAEGTLPGAPAELLDEALGLAPTDAQRADIGLALGRRLAAQD